MKKLALAYALATVVLFLAVACPPTPPPRPTPSADASPPPPPPQPRPTADAAPIPPLPPSDRYSLACANMGRVGCVDVDPKTCAQSLERALENHISPSLTQRSVDCLGVAPTKAGVRACTTFEKCP